MSVHIIFSRLLIILSYAVESILLRRTFVVRSLYTYNIFVNIKSLRVCVCVINDDIVIMRFPCHLCCNRPPVGEEQPGSERQDRMVGGPVRPRSDGAVPVEEFRGDGRRDHTAHTLRVEAVVRADAERRLLLAAELGPGRPHGHAGAQHAVRHILD